MSAHLLAAAFMFMGVAGILSETGPSMAAHWSLNVAPSSTCFLLFVMAPSW